MPRPARPWFRFYVEALSDRKLRRLTPAQRWLWVAVLGAARQSPIPGYLMVSEREPMDAHDLADIAAMPARDVQAALPKFEVAGMLRQDPKLGCWAVTAWHSRQYESDNVTERTRKHRSKERSNDAPGNAPDTETETESESEATAPDAEPAPAVTAEQRRQRIMEAARQVAEERAIGRNDIGPGWLAAAATGIAKDHHQELHAYLVKNPRATVLELIEDVIDAAGRTPAKTGGVTVDEAGMMVPGSGRVAYFRLEDQWRTSGEAS